MAFYETATDILQKLKDKKGTIKGLVFGSQSPEKKRLYGIICETLKYTEPLDCIINNSDLLKKEKKLNPHLAKLLVYELLFTKNISGNSKWKPIILSYKTRLNAELVKLKIRKKVKLNCELIPERIRNMACLPKYIRVNRNKTTCDVVIKHFIEKGFKLIENEDSNHPTKFIKKDQHIPDLFILPGSLDLHEDEFLLNGSYIIQDKASCFPAYILNPPQDSHVIDACAAPGNKTSHLSAIMKNTGIIHAFDSDKKRLETLKTLTKRANCKNIKPLNKSFLDVDPNDPEYSKVSLILLDPSCSGTGIVGRLDQLSEQEPQNLSKDRLKSLSDFQYETIMHSITFPNVKKIVYSTCSIHKEENEEVVERVLKSQNQFGLSLNVFPEWKRRGVDCFNGFEHVIRTESKEDMTIGFFVALFERK